MSIKTLADEYTKTKQEYMLSLQAKLTEEFKNFFQQNPEVKAISWTQYTPHYNDGETCYFGVNEFGVALTDDDADELKDQTIDTYDLQGKTSEKVKEFLKELRQLPSEVFEATFGDHAMVVATPEAFLVEEYAHD